MFDPEVTRRPTVRGEMPCPGAVVTGKHRRPHRGRERLWREVALYLEFWTIAREAAVAGAA